MKFSSFAQKFGSGAGIVSLMEDLGQALNVNPDLLFMGGGNPALIPEFEEEVRKITLELCDDEDRFHKMIGVYQSPRGNEQFIALMVEHINKMLGWDITPENLVVTNGSQSAFFVLMNMFSGAMELGGTGQVVFPMVPEYLGYADQFSQSDAFRSVRPKIELRSGNRFKYHIDFDSFDFCEGDTAVCVSCPSNPTANVISESELLQLSQMSAERGIPTIIDCAYGLPFPGLVFVDQKIPFHENNIYVFSCSKLGLPGVRTAMIVAPHDISEKVTSVNTILSLANGNIGPELMTQLIRSERLAPICENIIKPYYLARRDFALACVDKYFEGISYRVHEAEGAFFLWLWFEDLPISSTELYEMLKANDVLVMDGKHFFFGLEQGWQHSHECIRLTYCQSESVIETVIKRIADVVNAL